MEDKKYQIFVSSTYTDLIEQRDKVIKTILEMYHIPIGMEMFSADDDEQWETIRKTIDKSDYYILILGLRYGSKSDDGISFTEKEYNYALEQNKPILSFILDSNAPLSQKDRDNDLTDINSFRDKVLTNKKMADFWSNTDELTTKVSLALMKQISRNPQIGWLRADSLGLSPKVSEEIANLSEENRKLRDENDFLKSKLLDRKVDLQFFINSKSNLSVTIPKIVESKWTIQIPQQMTFDNCKEILKNYIKENCYKKHNAIEQMIHNIHREEEVCIEPSDTKYISQSMIDSYNGELPTESEVKDYNQLIEYFERIKFGLDLAFVVENVGTQKASSVIVNIEFPSEIVIVEKDLKEVEYPSFDNKPKMPNLKEFVKKIVEQKELANRPIIRASHSSFGINDMLSHHHYNHPTSFMDQIQPLINKNSDYVELIDPQNLKITIHSLLHTQNKVFDDEFVLVAKEVGKFEAKVSIISEEMEERKIIIVPIKVEYQ